MNKWNEGKVKNKDYFNSQRIRATGRLYINYTSDPDHDTRITRHECIVCYYNTKICGQGFTNYTCQNCDKESQHSNTCVPTLCIECSVELNLCGSCGGTL